MSAFSFTAPYITEEEELAEREALTEEEREQIRKDIGLIPFCRDKHEPNVSSLLPSSRVMAETIEQVHEQLEQLPETEAYRRAFASSPDVVTDETNIQAFLQVESSDATRTAKRVARYWNLRRDIFAAPSKGSSSNEEIMPLTLQGALTAEERALLSLGLVFMLPDDRYGRGVMYFDRTRFTLRVGTRRAFSRVLFYVLYAISYRNNPAFVIVINVKGFDLYKHFDRILLKNLLKMLEALPIDLKCIHMCGGPGSSVMSIVLPVIKCMFGAHLRLRTQTHSGSDYEISQKLKEFGLDEVHCLPFIRGAIYNQEQCAEFLKEQRKKEKTRRDGT